MREDPHFLELLQGNHFVVWIIIFLNNKRLDLKCFYMAPPVYMHGKF